MRDTEYTFHDLYKISVKEKMLRSGPIVKDLIMDKFVRNK